MKKRESHKRIFAYDTETHNGNAFIISTAYDEGVETIKVRNKEGVLKWFEYCVEKKYGNIGFAYNLDFDVLAVMKYFGETVLLHLYFYREVEIGDFVIGYVSKKFFTIKRGNKIVYIFELMQYYNMSLDKAGEKYLNWRKIEIGGKDAKKNIFALYKKNPGKIIKYCERDAELTRKLGERLNKLTENYGIDTNKYYSCGYLAKTYLKSKDIRFKPLRDTTTQEFVKRAYFGGRIEFTQRGYFKKVYQYDINSAYPYAATELYNIVHTKFSNYIDSDATYFFVEVDLYLRNKTLSPLPFRTDTGLIIYPVGNINGVVVDNFTYEILKREGAVLRTGKTLNVYCNTKQPFREMILKLYRDRFKGDEDTAYIIKIILNSLYGKMAEKRSDYVPIDEDTALEYIDRYEGGEDIPRVHYSEIGYFMRQLSYAPGSNLIYAALITARIRAMIYETAKGLKPENYIGAMTDCIFSKTPLPGSFISDKKELGKFGLKEKSECYIIGSGVYSSGKENKLRGYNMKANLVDLAKKNRSKSTLQIAATERKSIGKMAMQSAFLEHLNLIADVEKNLNLNFDNKREWNGGFNNFGESLRKFILSKPLFLR